MASLIDSAPEKQFFWPVRVYYEDTDAGGVVYHANYLKYFERARTERLRSFGIEQDELRRDHGVLFAVRSVQAEYLKPARFNDSLWVSAAVSGIKRASLCFVQEIRLNDAAGDILCEAGFRIACLDARSMKATAIPDFLLQRMKDEL